MCACVYMRLHSHVCVCLSLQFISSHVGKLKLFAVLYTATASVKFVHFAYHWRFDKLQLQKQQQQLQTTLMLHCRRCHLFDISSNRHNQPSKRVQKMFDLIYWKCQGNFMSMVNYDWVIVFSAFTDAAGAVCYLKLQPIKRIWIKAPHCSKPLQQWRHTIRTHMHARRILNGVAICNLLKSDEVCSTKVHIAYVLCVVAWCFLLCMLHISV